MGQFQKGHKFAKGGARPGSGAKPKKFKTWCKRLVNDRNRQKVIEDILDGKDMEVRLTKDGEKVMMPAPTAVRADVFFELADRAEGKPVSLLEMKDEDGNPMALHAVVVLPSEDQGKTGEVKK